MVSSSDRATIVYVAKLADQAERYDDMVEGLMKLAKMDVDLTAEEKILLSAGYKQVIFSRRASWRILSSIEQKEHNEQNTKRIKEYMQKVETELTHICNQVISVIDKHLIPSCTDGTALVFYYKMSGDYYRYLAELKTGDDRKVVVDQAQSAYELATTTAKAELPCTHPIRLGLALNFAVFYYEILKSTERACEVAEQAFQEALPLLGTLNEESFKDTTLIMQLLGDNLLLWINGESHDAEENAAKAEKWERWCREQLSSD